MHLQVQGNISFFFCPSWVLQGKDLLPWLSDIPCQPMLPFQWSSLKKYEWTICFEKLDFPRDWCGKKKCYLKWILLAQISLLDMISNQDLIFKHNKKNFDKPSFTKKKLTTNDTSLRQHTPISIRSFKRPGVPMTMSWVYRRNKPVIQL